MRLSMTYRNHNPGLLWGQFMPRRREITNPLDRALYSLQGTDSTQLLTQIELDTPFDKWALVEVSDFYNVPDGMETFTLAAGTYAVFNHVGNTPESIMNAWRYILEEWLPGSGFVLDYRPHFEKLGEKYDRFRPDSEEEIWVPVKRG